MVYKCVRFTLWQLIINKYNNMNLTKIYSELQQIDEFHANFNPTSESKSRMRKLISLIPISKYDRVR